MIYQLGPWLFDSDLCLLSNDDIKKELDPLLVKLLRYFIAHPKQIISRQMLVEHVWQQTFVDDNAINRAMSELRKQLQHSELVEPLIKTHYRKGYSLQLLPKTIETQIYRLPCRRKIPSVGSPGAFPGGVRLACV